MTFITGAIYLSAGWKYSRKKKIIQAHEKLGKLKDGQDVVLNLILGSKPTKQNC